MTYVDSHSNTEIINYFKILSSDYPNFIDKYIRTLEMQRLHSIGQFCGCDYTKLHSCKYWYSRLDHSIACALMTWHFTKNKTQTLCALFHDLGTPAFSHCVDYLLNDFLDQESSEKNINEIILNSDQITRYLTEDKISIDEVLDINRYTIVENKKPKICVDRLDGILHTGLVWCHFWELKDIKEIYDDIVVLTNEQNEQELGFNDLKIADEFFKGTFKYSVALQQNEDKLTMQFIADCLRKLIDNKSITFQSLYLLSEQEIINIIKNDNSINAKWGIFENASVLTRTDVKPEDKYFISVDCKKRYAIPLIRHNKQVVRLNKISKDCDNLLNEYLNYNDSKFAYIDFE